MDPLFPFSFLNVLERGVKAANHNQRATVDPVDGVLKFSEQKKTRSVYKVSRKWFRRSVIEQHYHLFFSRHEAKLVQVTIEVIISGLK